MEQNENAREWVKRGWNGLMTADPDRMKPHIIRKESPNNPPSPNIFTICSNNTGWAWNRPKTGAFG
jgi:hypothetical protein